ncbi:MAG: hypothetical protein IJO40_01970, partial [Thermoguttaceae bacterium]|nr:hypothetical protein [Thermoguttaceae bacterium]
PTLALSVFPGFARPKIDGRELFKNRSSFPFPRASLAQSADVAPVKRSKSPTRRQNATGVYDF